MELIRIISWNMKQKAANWQIVFDSDVDAAILQEAKEPPNDLKKEFIVDRTREWVEVYTKYLLVMQVEVTLIKV